MDEMISKQAAIDVIDAVFPVDPMKSEYAQGIACGAALAKTYVEQLPPAQQEHWSRQLVYHQDNVTDLRSKFVNIIVKHFKNASAFLDYIDTEKYTSDFDCFCSFDGECYIICRNTGEYVNWYKFTHIGRDIHTNMTVEQLDFFIERFSKAEC